MRTVLDSLNYQVEQLPDKTLFSFLDINGNQTEHYTYAEFSERTKVIASHLATHYKFKQGDRILLAFPPGVEMICAFFACVQLGLIPVPTYPPTSAGFQSSYYKMAFIAKDSGAAAVLTSRDYYWSLKLNLDRNNIKEKTRLSKIPWINTEEFRDFAMSEVPQYHSDTLFIQYTSGSTNDPKGVIVSNENMVYNADITMDHIPVGVSWLPQYHDMGLIGYYIFFAIKGGTTHGFSSLDFIRRPALWLETITKYKGTASSAPNFAYDYILQPGKLSEETLNSIDLSSISFLMTAAEPVRPDVYRKFVEFFKPYGLDPKAHFAAFGLAENTLAVTNYGRQSLSLDTTKLQMNKLEIVADEHEEGVTEVMSCGVELGDNVVKIVDPETNLDLGTDAIGEVWVKGTSRCHGYWGRKEQSEHTFWAKLANNDDQDPYMRTGDMGFMHNKELFICGRLKDMIIVRGLNYYPQDIEAIVEDISPEIRRGFVAAFEITEDGEEKLVIVAGVKNKKQVPNALKITEEIRKKLNILTHAITFVSNKSIPKTSSGKIMRQKTKQQWLANELEIIEDFSSPAEIEVAGSQNGKGADDDPFLAVKRKYGFTGEETYSLITALDSLDLAVLIHDIKELLKSHGANTMAKQIDTRLLQEISISEFFALIEQFSTSSQLAIKRLRDTILRLQKEHVKYEQKRMREDAVLSFKPSNNADYSKTNFNSGKVLITGGTGFFGPFLIKSLLEQTDDTLYVLVRAENEEKGKERLKNAMELNGVYHDQYIQLFDERVIAVCGDLGKSKLGMSKENWEFLTEEIHSIYNNGALVNYLFNYEKMRAANVDGTNEIIRFALAGQSKVLNHISTTFSWGWAVKDILLENDHNDDLDLLDFGYSQTKWVSERIVKDAMNKVGLQARVFRPALITPSVDGGGNNFDISIRLMAYMVNHNMDVDAHNQVSFTPADVAANNIIALSQMEDTMDETFHVVRDDYATMMDITNIITDLTGVTFKRFTMKNFVPEIVDTCEREDLLFPLLEFFVRSVDKISSMEFKRYDSTRFQEARNRSPYGQPDPSLEETVRGILLFMKKHKVIPEDLVIEEAALPKSN